MRYNILILLVFYSGLLFSADKKESAVADSFCMGLLLVEHAKVLHGIGDTLVHVHLHLTHLLDLAQARQ